MMFRINGCCVLGSWVVGWLVVAGALTAEPAEELPGTLPGKPYDAADFAAMRVTEAWAKYADRLTWGRGQCLAILDDGCDLSQPAWKAKLPWGNKVLATFDSIEGDADPSHVKPGYHGTTVGYPSSMNVDGVLGVAFNNHVAHVRCASVVHLTKDESLTIAAALEWVIKHHQEYNITAVNLAVLDDQERSETLATAIDEPLAKLRQLGIWVSAPCGNHHFTRGISWPATQPGLFAIGGAVPGRHVVHLDRSAATDLMVSATATSSSNAYAAGSAMILREAIEKSGYDWKQDGATLPDAMLAIFQQTGNKLIDPPTGLQFRELDLLAALDHVFAAEKKSESK